MRQLIKFSFTQYNLSYLRFVPNVKILVVPEKVAYTPRQTLLRKRQNTIYPLYTLFTGGITMALTDQAVMGTILSSADDPKLALTF